MKTMRMASSGTRNGDGRDVRPGTLSFQKSNGRGGAARKTRILIIEDEPAMVAGLRDSTKGYEVISADDGVAGLERVFADDPDLVVLDVMMPRMSGLDVCKQIKAGRPSVPVIMLTARPGNRQGRRPRARRR